MKYRLTTALLTLCMILPGSGQEPSLVNSNGAQIDTDTERAAFRQALDVAAWGRAGFYDNFSDLSRYPEGAVVTDGVTMPQVGSSPWAWKKNDGGAPADIKMYVTNGGLRAPRLGGGYLACQGTPEDHLHYNYGFEFTREDTRWTEGGASGAATANFTITVGPAPLTSGGTHNAWGRIHANLNPSGINSIPVFQSGWSVTVDTAADTLTLGAVTHPSAPNPPPIESGDYIQFGGTLPTGVPSTSAGYAIKISSTVYKVAATKALALAGTALDLTTTGSGVSVGRALECLNRAYDGTHYPWRPRRVITRRCSFTAASDLVTTTTPHFLGANTAVAFEGDNLASGLTGAAVYYVRDVTLTTFKVSLTPGGTAIDLTTNGGADQYVRGLAAHNAVTSCMPHGRRTVILIAVRGDYMDWTLVGVGTVSFYFRDLAYVMGSSGAVGFYWQTPPEQATGPTNYPATYALHAAWIDAPQVEAAHVERMETYLSTLNAANSHELPGRLWLQPPNGNYFSTMLDALSSDSIRAVAVARTTKTLGAARPVGGHFFAEGLYMSNPMYTDAGASVAGFAPATLAGIEGSFSSTAGGPTNLAGAALAGPGVMETGETQQWIFAGTLGTGAKRIQLVYSSLELAGDVFDSNLAGTPLDALNNVPYTITIERMQTASVSHLTYATMHVAGLVIGPQRLALNAAGSYRNLLVRTTTANAGGVVVDFGRTTIHRTKPQY